MAQAGWEHYEHGADIGVRGRAPDLAGAFAQAALAMTAVICPPESVRAHTELRFDCEAPDIELLFVDWLNRLIFEMSSRHMLFSRFELALQPPRLHARVWGEAIDAARHQPAVEVKGATYTTLKVWQDEAGYWCAQTVVDV
jgi:tRNA nucleotidyltransferase (CCA-adding enzyme)